MGGMITAYREYCIKKNRCSRNPCISCEGCSLIPAPFNRCPHGDFELAATQRNQHEPALLARWIREHEAELYVTGAGVAYCLILVYTFFALRASR